LYADAVHQFHSGISVWRLENRKDPRSFRLVFTNPTAEKSSTSTPGTEVSGKSLAEVCPNLVETQIPKIFQEVVVSAKAKDLGEVRCDNEKGSSWVFRMRVYPLADQFVCVAFENLTEQKDAEKKDSTQPQLLDLATDAILCRDMDGRVTYWNHGAERMYGWTKQEVLGQSAFDVLQSAFPRPLDEIKKMLLHDGHWAGELVHTKKDGTKITVASHWTLRRDENGDAIGWIQINNDVTQVRKVQEGLRESEEGFRLLVDAVRDYAIFRLDQQGNILTWNSGARRIKGYSAEEIIGKHFSAFYPPEDGASGKPDEALRIATQEGRFESEGWRLRKDHSRFWAHVTISALRDEEGKLRGFAKVTQDVTERREAEKVRLEARALEERTNEITLLSGMASLLQACLTSEEAFRIIGQFAARLFPAESGALYILSPSRNAVEEAAVWGAHEIGEKVFPPEDCWALRGGRMHYVDESRKAVLCRHLGRWPDVSHLCVPMTAQGDTLGILHIHSNSGDAEAAKQPMQPLSATRQHLALTVAEHVGLALANLKLRETLRIQSVRDPLTGLFNRRFMQESFDRELRRAARTNRALGGILLDIDHFKQFNDSFGHEAGDLVLREVGTFLQSQIRGGDIACRVGGEEFMLILPDASLDVTQQRAEKVREAIKQVCVQYGGRLMGMITVSSGVAVFPTHGTTSDALLRSADEALYQAKAQGRDRVVVAKPMAEAT
jgi:diguanylate cyclase (GGDEF)-like protein/PAS domain S-box-containing protein